MAAQSASKQVEGSSASQQASVEAGSRAGRKCRLEFVAAARGGCMRYHRDVLHTSRASVPETVDCTPQPTCPTRPLPSRALAADSAHAGPVNRPSTSAPSIRANKATRWNTAGKAAGVVAVRTGCCCSPALHRWPGLQTCGGSGCCTSETSQQAGRCKVQCAGQGLLHAA